MNKKINWKSDVDEFIDEAVERWERFLESFNGDETLLIDIRNAKEDTHEHSLLVNEGWSFVYTNRGMNLATRFLDRLYKVASKYFPDEKFIDIHSHLYREQ